MNKLPDLKAAEIDFGVELETVVPQACALSVGTYHAGNPVRFALAERRRVTAPLFNDLPWQTKRDGSITVPDTYMGCEFVSPRLHGPEGLVALDSLIAFVKAIGGMVNASCGCHVTVSIPKTIGSTEPRDIARFVRKLVRVANRHAWAIFAQTGTHRHTSIYAKPLPVNAGEMTNELAQAEAHGDQSKRMPTVDSTGRGMVNLRKVYPPRLADSCVEFRAFAGTLNRLKVMHHVATCLGLMRKAHVTKSVPHFTVERKAGDACEAVHRMWVHLGWSDDACSSDTALGLFGLYHEQFGQHATLALKMASKFEAANPKAKI